MEKINIFDNAISPEDIIKIKHFFENEKWIYSYKNYLLDYHDFPFWKVYLDKEPFFNFYFTNIINKLLFNNYIIHRVYAVAQCYGENSNYHTDSKNNNYFTFCLYLNNLSSTDIEENNGNIYFKNINSKEIIAIEPINNRAVFFPSNYIHKGSGFIKNNDIRICITWKLKYIENGDI